MPEFTLNVFFQNNDYVKQLEQERDEAVKKAADMVRLSNSLQFECINEKHVNMELIDKLRENGIRFRSSSDMSKWKGK